MSPNPGSSALPAAPLDELTAARKELERSHDEVLRLHGELAESRRGVLAMHHEMEDRAAELARSVQVESRIVADAGHDLRTPLHAILVLARLLGDGVDGPLTAEQAKQVHFVRKSAEELLKLVDGLLDLSRADLGRSILRIEAFTLADFVAAMRGSLRPLVAQGSPVSLLFDEPPALVLETDRAKLGQIVRSLVSNALKPTEAGEVRVRFASAADGTLEIAVSDTRIGIAVGDPERRLAQQLGGDIRVQGAPDSGSVFTLSVPASHPEARQAPRPAASRASEPPGSERDCGSPPSHLTAGRRGDRPAATAASGPRRT